MNRYADCSYCGGEVVEQTIVTSDGREQCPRRRLPPVRSKVFKPDILKKMDSVYHGIFERHEKAQWTLTFLAFHSSQPRNRSSIDKFAASFRRFENSRNVEVSLHSAVLH